MNSEHQITFDKSIYFKERLKDKYGPDVTLSVLSVKELSEYYDYQLVLSPNYAKRNMFDMYYILIREIEQKYCE